MNLNIFAPLTKVDEEKREVWGRAVAEVADRSKEIFDYESSKPLFEKWSDGLNKTTNGKSLGNVRAMHGKVAAGKLTSIHYNDVEKAIDVCAKIVDDNEWNKVKEGVYTGFSIGGKYAKRWKDNELHRYTADPMEVSVVDVPCVPSATFSLVKSDGTELHKSFQNTADDGFIAGENLEKIVEREGVNPKEGTEKYGKVRFADSKNKKYPIDTEAHIRAAWSYINMPKNAKKYDSSDLATIKSRIVSAWKSKIDKSGPTSEAEKALTVTDLEKGMYSVSRLAVMLADLDSLEDNVNYEAEQEQDGSPIPQRLRDAVKTLGDILRDMVEEEVTEMTQEETQMSEKASQISDLTKADFDSMADNVKELTKSVQSLLDMNKSLAEQNVELAKQFNELKAQPETPKAGVLSVVEKKADGYAKNDEEERLRQLEKNGDVEELIKSAWSTPMTPRY